MKNKRKKIFLAFTLAEVLITLGIIGVVAALTIPNLIQQADNVSNAKALLKIYSAFNNAINLYIADNGGDFKDTAVFASGNDNTEIWNAFFKKYFKISQDCFATSGCFVNGTIRLNGGGWQSLAVNATGTSRLTLEDGMNIRVWNNGGNCNSECLEISVDVNGLKKPNKVGRDTFLFSLTKNKLLPYGNNGSDCINSGSGFTCAYRIIKEGGMNY